MLFIYDQSLPNYIINKVYVDFYDFPHCVFPESVNWNKPEIPQISDHLGLGCELVMDILM